MRRIYFMCRLNLPLRNVRAISRLKVLKITHNNSLIKNVNVNTCFQIIPLVAFKKPELCFCTKVNSLKISPDLLWCSNTDCDFFLNILCVRRKKNRTSYTIVCDDRPTKKVKKKPTYNLRNYYPNRRECLRFFMHRLLNNSKLLSVLRYLTGKINLQQNMMLRLVKICTSKPYHVFTVCNSPTWPSSSAHYTLAIEAKLSALPCPQQLALPSFRGSEIPGDNADYGQHKQSYVTADEACSQDEEAILLLRIQQQKHLWSRNTAEQNEEEMIIQRLQQFQDNLHDYDPRLSSLIACILHHQHALKKLLAFVEQRINTFKFKIEVWLQNNLQRKLSKFKSFQYYLNDQVAYGQQLMSKLYNLYILKQRNINTSHDTEIHYLFHLSDVEQLSLEIYKIDMEIEK